MSPYSPGAHGMQLRLLPAPSVGRCVPRGHGEGVTVPAPQKWPRGQGPPHVLSVALVVLPTKPAAHADDLYFALMEGVGGEYAGGAPSMSDTRGSAWKSAGTWGISSESCLRIDSCAAAVAPP